MADNSFWNQDWMKLQEQYWNQWSEMQKKALGIAEKPKLDPWQAAMQHWWDAVGGAVPDPGRDFLQKAMEQGRQAFELAEQFSKSMLKEDGWKQLTDLLTKSFTGTGNSGLGSASGFWEMPLDNWQRMASALSPLPGDLLRGMPTTGLKENLDKVLGAPGLGYTRESQTQYQSLLQSLMEYHEALGEYTLFFTRLGEGASRRLLELLQEKPVESARGLYDTWVQCCEARYADEVMTPEYQRLHGRLVNALMQLKHRWGELLNEYLSAMNIPTRDDMRTLQQRVQEHRRELHAVRRELAELRKSLASQEAPPAQTRAGPQAAAAKSKPTKATPAKAKPGRKIAKKA